MGHPVICAVCGKKFDRDSVQAVKFNARRYAHYECKPDGELVPLVSKEIDPDLVQLKEYISKLFGDNTNWALVNRQIKKFREENNYSYSGILKSLIYFFEVKHNPVDKANNAIGIVPFCYKDAYNYYLALYMAQHANKDKTLVQTVREITIKPPQKQNALKREFFDLEGWEENYEEQ